MDVCVEKYVVTGDAPRIGIIRDASFQFYYPENLEALEAAGAELVFTSPLTKQPCRPSMHSISAEGFRKHMQNSWRRTLPIETRSAALAEKGLPIYAECGGLMYLGERLLLEDDAYAMAGVFPLVFDLHKRPQGHGYTIVSVDHENPYFEVGTEIRGHEFHYSKAIEYRGSMDLLAFQVQTGGGIDQRQGWHLPKKSFGHLHAHPFPGNTLVGQEHGGKCSLFSKKPTITPKTISRIQSVQQAVLRNTAGR